MKSHQSLIAVSAVLALVFSLVASTVSAQSGRQFIVYFGANPSGLTVEAAEVVNEAARAAYAAGAKRVIVTGQADSKESSARSIAQARADAVASFFGRLVSGISVETRAEVLDSYGDGVEPQNRRAIIDVVE